jgi:predicted dehydrogenase
MNFLILGDGPDERLWASYLADHPEHSVIAASPGFPDILPGAPTPVDLDGALAVGGVEAVIVGGSLAFRDEALRRSAALGFASICLHPPGENADPYYQVALSREETGAIVVPDLPGRLHPGVVTIREEFNRGALGKFRSLTIEVPGDPAEPDLTAATFPRWVDLARVFLGEVLSLTALGDPPGDHPTRSLTVQLRGTQGRMAELRLTASGPDSPARIVLTGGTGSLTLEVSPGWAGPSLLIGPGGRSTELPPWSPRGALLEIFTLAVSGRPTRPNLIDGTRAMELTSAARRSLRRGRSIDLHYEEVSEANNFKTVMTSVGCMVLLGILVALPAALVGPALGIGQTIYIAYAIPPILILFAMLQFLRLVLKPSRAKSPEELEVSG